jgi:alanyl-tRNA synthetase
VYALGFIGPVKILSESSIGSNLRRIEAVTGEGALTYVEEEEALLRRVGTLLRAAPKEIPEKIERLSEQVRALQDELQKFKAKESLSAAADLAQHAVDGAVVTRHDGLSNDELRRLAQETVRALGSGVVALAGTGPDGVKAGIAVAVSKDLIERGVSADAIARPAAKALGGGVGKGTDAVVGGGANAAGIDEALRLVREQITTLR